MQRDNKHMIKGSTSLVSRVMEIEITNYHFTPIWMAIIKEREANKYCPGCEETESLFIGGGYIKYHSLENSLAVPQKVNHNILM